MNARAMTDFATLDNPTSSLLEAVGVGVSIGDKTLLQPTTCAFQTGQVTAILGPNGAGKSTLMSVLTGQRLPDVGHVQFQGQNLKDCTPAELAKLRAFVAQETQVAFDFTVREVVELGRYPHRRQPSTQEAHIPQLAMQSTHVRHLEERSLNTLSGGEKARAHLARALAQVWEATITPYAAPGRPKQVQPPRGAESYMIVSEKWGSFVGVIYLIAPSSWRR